jgi:adenylate kinase
MQDDFDSEMGIPDDELAGESAMTEGDALGGHDADVELEAPEAETVGRASGGARAMSSGAAKAAPRRKAAPAASKGAKKAAKPAKKAKAAKKGAKPAKKSAKAAAKGGSKKKAVKKSAAKRKAGKKK